MAEDIKKLILAELELSEEEKKALRRAHSNITQIKEELIDEEKIASKIDELIQEAYRYLEQLEEIFKEFKDIPSSRFGYARERLAEAANIYNTKLNPVVYELDKYEKELMKDKKVSDKFMVLFQKHRVELGIFQQHYVRLIKEADFKIPSR